ncbi:MAG: recombinase family protein [Nocardioidaceae bacterium]
MELGYARLSINRGDLDAQLAALAGRGIERARTFTDTEIGAGAQPGLAALLATADPGDVLVVTSLDRLGHNIGACLTMARTLAERDLGLVILHDPAGLDTTTDPGAAALLTWMGHAESVFLRERAAHARAQQPAAGPRGRPRALTETQLETARARVNAGESVASLARELKLNRQTLHRALQRQRGADGGAR